MAKVLLIEDEKAMSDLIAVKFRVEGFEVDQALTLADAKAKLAAGPYQAMLTDYLLPDGNLPDFLAEVRSNPQTKNLPVMVMTNYVEDINAEQMRNLGVVEVLVKYQVVPAQMVEKIRMLINATSNTGGVNGQPNPA